MPLILVLVDFAHEMFLGVFLGWGWGVNIGSSSIGSICKE